MRLRQPILTVLGHVDVGKTSLLDKIRGTAIHLKEAGGITQHIGASFLPTDVIIKIARKLIEKYKINLQIPGILLIDTPGHEIFSNLRRRGGSVADMAILVIDILKGLEKQTYESIEILKSRKVPFLIALNKLDKFEGWKATETYYFTESLELQSEKVKDKLDERIYEIVAKLSSLGIVSERFDRVKDFSKTVAIVPTSAIYGIGIAELLLVISGFAQLYLKSRIAYTEGLAEGVVLEVKEEIGLGKTIDVIIFNGILKKGDLIALASSDGVIITKVKGLLMPKPLEEMRAPEDKFYYVNEVVAASGVKILADNLSNVIPGSPLYAITKEKMNETIKKIEEEITSIKIKTDKEGVVVKADTLGVLEAFVSYLKNLNIPVRLADLGAVSKNDVFEAFVSKNLNKIYGVILAFNVKILPEAEEEILSKNIKIISGNVLYKIIEEYLEYVKKIKEEEKLIDFSKLPYPSVVRVLPGYIFRRSDPAIFGIEVILGKIRPGLKLVNEKGKIVGQILQIQEHGKPLNEAKKGMQVAISLKGEAFVGRNIFEGEKLYVYITYDEAKYLLEKYKSEFEEEEIKYLENIIKKFF